MTRSFLMPVVGGLVLFIATPACAQIPYSSARPYGYSDIRRVAYDNGFREGLREGEKDGRQRDRFEYRDEGDFQRADVGFNRGFGDIERYRQTFRAGFADGYTEGFGRYSRGYRDGRYNGGRYGYYSPAFDNGARDGFEKGAEDARDHDRFDARRHQWYRAGDRHYKNEYGPRQQYEDEYRRGFLAGYEQGYRNYR